MPTQSILEGGGKNLEVVAGIIFRKRITSDIFKLPNSAGCLTCGRPEARTLVWVKPATNQNAFVLLIDIQWRTDVSSASVGATS